MTFCLGWITLPVGKGFNSANVELGAKTGLNVWACLNWCHSLRVPHMAVAQAVTCYPLVGLLFCLLLHGIHFPFGSFC